MKAFALSLFVFHLAWVTAADKQPEKKGAPAGKTAEEKGKRIPLKLLSKEQLDTLLRRRVQGGMDYKFYQFANMFFVSSNIATGTGIVLSGQSKEISETELQSPFPAFYKPTLSEFFDAIGWQTFSKWSYDKDKQFGWSTVPDAKEMEGVVIAFTPQEHRPKPYKITIIEGWRSEDRGNWETYIPPTAPVGMDIYEMGRYSATKRDKKTALMERVRKEVGLEWAQRVKPDAKPEELKPAKVGEFEALHFESLIDARAGGKVHWRHWVFTAEDRCFFIVSTLFPDQEERLFKDVRKMIESFELVKP